MNPEIIKKRDTHSVCKTQEVFYYLNGKTEIYDNTISK